MWKLFWKSYKTWLLVCVVVVVVSLGFFFAFFQARYSKLRQEDLRASLERFEAQIRDNQEFSGRLGKLPRKKRLPNDLDYELALRTVERVQQLMESGQMEYEDFAKLRYLNQLPLDRRLTGREYNKLFQEMDQLMDLKLAGKLDPLDELPASQGIEEASGETVSPATEGDVLSSEATPESSAAAGE